MFFSVFLIACLVTYGTIRAIKNTLNHIFPPKVIVLKASTAATSVTISHTTIIRPRGGYRNNRRRPTTATHISTRPRQYRFKNTRRPAWDYIEKGIDLNKWQLHERPTTSKTTTTTRKKKTLFELVIEEIQSKLAYWDSLKVTKPHGKQDFVSSVLAEIETKRAHMRRTKQFTDAKSTKTPKRFALRIATAIEVPEILIIKRAENGNFTKEIGNLTTKRNQTTPFTLKRPRYNLKNTRKPKWKTVVPSTTRPKKKLNNTRRPQWDHVAHYITLENWRLHPRPSTTTISTSTRIKTFFELVLEDIEMKLEQRRSKPTEYATKMLAADLMKLLKKTKKSKHGLRIATNTTIKQINRTKALRYADDGRYPPSTIKPRPKKTLKNTRSAKWTTTVLTHPTRPRNKLKNTRWPAWDHFLSSITLEKWRLHERPSTRRLITTTRIKSFFDLVLEEISLFYTKPTQRMYGNMTPSTRKMKSEKFYYINRAQPWRIGAKETVKLISKRSFRILNRQRKPSGTKHEQNNGIRVQRGCNNIKKQH